MDRFIGNPTNIFAGQTSYFVVIRTGVTNPAGFLTNNTFPNGPDIEGFGGAMNASAFAPAVPEPTVIGMLGLSALFLGRRRLRRW